MGEQRFEYSVRLTYKGRIGERERIITQRSKEGWRLVTFLMHPAVEGETAIEMWFERPFQKDYWHTRVEP